MLKRVSFFILAYMFSYFLIEWAGLFTAGRPPLHAVLLSGPMVAAAVALLLVVLSASVKNFKRFGASRWLGVTSVFLVVTGLIVSYLTGFKTQIVLTEGQRYVYVAGEEPESGYAGKLSGMGDFMIGLKEVSSGIDGVGKKIGPTKGLFLFQTRDMNSPLSIDISDGLPEAIKGMFFSIEEVGYSPRFAIRKAGKALDSAFVSLRVYPFGREDYFRSLSPHTFYVRYDPQHLEDGAEKPFKVRIARNKDILHNGYVGIREGIKFEDATISFEELRMWTKISIRRDFGIPIVFAGVIAGCGSAVVWLRDRRRRRG